MATNRECKPNIPNISIYSELGDFTVWSVDDIEDRTVDFSIYNVADDEFWKTTINSIINLILKYKIVYFVNCPFEYFEIFNQLNNEFCKKLRINGVVQNNA